MITLSPRLRSRTPAICFPGVPACSFCVPGEGGWPGAGSPDSETDRGRAWSCRRLAGMEGTAQGLQLRAQLRSWLRHPPPRLLSSASSALFNHLILTSSWFINSLVNELN